jgi:hypothetical protein
MYFTLYRKDELKLEGMLLNVVDFEWMPCAHIQLHQNCFQYLIVVYYQQAKSIDIM